MKKIYDFICGDCGELFEKLTDTPDKVECKKCGSLNTMKQFNRSYAFKVLGDGAYDKHMKVAK